MLDQKNQLEYQILNHENVEIKDYRTPNKHYFYLKEQSVNTSLHPDKTSVTRQSFKDELYDGLSQL